MIIICCAYFVSKLKPAFAIAFEEHLAELKAIVEAPAVTFDNTVKVWLL
jgi:hypothetical protein